MKPYLNLGIAIELLDINIFNKAKVSMGTIMWPNGYDVCPDFLYEESNPKK